uniref:Putative secreted protein n=1 Tax=Anopheles marajoara TaxID=58244 RepID=A0A2M4C7A1_9DIPT
MVVVSHLLACGFFFRSALSLIIAGRHKGATEIVVGDEDGPAESVRARSRLVCGSQPPPPPHNRRRDVRDVDDDAMTRKRRSITCVVRSCPRAGETRRVSLCDRSTPKRCHRQTAEPFGRGSLSAAK